jgi:pimeloyl-ACP methyl ester carboxylesterase
MMTGDADLNMPPAIARMFASRFPNAELALIAEAGHSAHWEQPEIFNRLVLDFIARH